ncbi:MAG: acyltransferase domain-containing protein, partial [Thermoguttaceae bacterium]|nr:acyltransferase domain-containing protein [Thermoguttaceae bacterium]
MGKGIDQRASASSTGSIWGSPYPLAIVGFSCYLPDATSPEKYWENLFNNRVSYRPYASPRFPNVIYEPDPKGEKKAKKGRSYSNLAALVDFDSFCNIEVPKMRAEFASHGVGIDVLPKAPGHLLALKVALEALRSTGVDPFCLPSSSVGVFCGLVSSNRPEEFSPVNSNVNVLIDVLNELPSFQSLPANLRVSALKSFLTEYPSACVMGRDEFVSDEQPHHLIRSIQAALGLYGTGFAFDAACSSSLLAFELARNYLQCGDLDAAIVGGMTLLAQTHLVSFSEASVHSTKGSFPFDRRADGLIPGEGCVFAVVKSLEKAVVDGDHILAVVRGIGFSSDGRGKSVWAPSLDGQKLALERAFHDAKYHSWSEFDRIEAHATSTQLGDATELQSLSSAMTETPMAENVKIPITSVKANIGHLLEAAGAASVLKVVLELSNEQKLKQTSFAVPSSKFNWNSSPMRILLENEPWKVRSGYIRKACVQAFGIGGLNAQVVIEGPEGSVNVPTQTEPTQLKQIAIIGIGCVLPGAFDISSFKALIDKCESAITPIPQDRALMLFSKADRAESASLFHKARGGFIQGYNYDWKRHRIPPKHIKNANPLQFMTLDAADQAILSAGYRSHLQKVDSQDVSDTSLKALDSHSTAVVVGTRTDGDFLDALRLEVLTPVYRSRLEKVLENEGAAPDVARVIGENFSNAVYNSEDTCLEDETSSGSISTLASRITKTYDLMGGGVTLDAGNISSFTALKNAALLLERRPELRCVVCVSSHSSMNEKSLKKCTEQGITPGEGAVAFVIKRVEDARQDGDRILAVFSRVEEERLKENDAYHACQKLEEFTKNLPTQANDNSPVFIETICDVDRTVERKVNAETKKIAATNVFEIFGETRVSTRDLIGDLRPASGAVAILNAVINMQDCAGNPRAVVSQWDSDGMVAQVKLEKEPIEIKKVPLGSNSMTSTKQKFVHSKHNDRVVFLFPGQGSQYPQMLAPLLRATPEAREVCEKLDDELKSLGFPTFKELAIDNSTALGVDVTATQISLLVADTIIDRTLRKLGIEPDMIAGHSYGEYPAMVAAGTLSFADALRATCERCRIIDETIVKSGTSTGMLSTNAPKEVVQRIFDRLRSRF